ncbi:MAG: DUF748 domain-containing protein [Flavobacteriales bacterium]|nr:DUF748 domain-containing protein [Flavobacteriales bacterium]
MRRTLKFVGKALLLVAAAVLVVLVLALVFHPPILRWAIAKYSPAHTGRQVTVEHIHLNPFTGNVHIRGLHVLEEARDTVFLHVDTIDVNTTLYKMLGGTYEVTSVRVARPFVRILQHGERFNFSDLVDRFAGDTVPEPAPDAADTVPVHWALRDLALTGGRLHYQSDLMPAPLGVEGLQVSSPGLAWDQDLIEVMAALHLDDGSRLRTSLAYEQASARYAVDAELDSVPLRTLEPYVRPYMRIGALGGLAQGRFQVRGDADEASDLGLRGDLHLRDASLTDPAQVKLLALGALDIVVDTIDVKGEHYRIRRFTADRPYCLFELYDNGDNWTRLLAADTVASSLAAEEELGYDPMNPFSMLAYYVQLVAEDYDALDYRVDSLAIRNGAVDFNDHTLQNTFRYKLTDLTLTTNGIDSKRDSITLFAHSHLNGTGTFDARMDLDPNSLRNMHFRYDIVSLGMPDFGPYTTFFLAHPVLSGVTTYHNETHIVDNKLRSVNHVLVEDFQFGRKMNVATAFQLPVRLAVSLLKDKDGNIELDIPVEGDLDDPEYRVMPIVWQVLKNLVVKAVTAPANLLARALKVDEDDLKGVRFLYLQEDLTSKQEKPLRTVARVAESKPDVRIELVQCGDREGEAEAHALLLARKAYVEDSTGAALTLPKVELEAELGRIDIRSPGFLAWLDRTAGASSDPIQKRCMRYVGEEALRAEVDRLYAARITLVKAFLLQEHSLGPDRITVRDATPADKLPASGQPYFELKYGNTDGGE